ncbi:phage tail assembly protein [Microvirga sp. 17 mud 1-3]|uniref:phage tail assembly protein n=1 Tax=Microvirga sp. 17 mud 1-3 TaxID=2082949 RepID=UPI000D6BE9FA|nr:phage tail assembly protein [Microvirga sp. 17 mud 1-3]AWM87378.1 phage tail assembly protein [Microvirga sp. 17 mud 1-3]
MAKRQTPDYIKLTEGQAAVTLSRPLEIDGAKVNVLTMREPLVMDQLAAQKAGADSSSQEISLMANLCGIVPDDLHKLPLRDYARLQVAFGFFTD